MKKIFIFFSLTTTLFAQSSLLPEGKSKVRGIFKNELACFLLKEGRSQTFEINLGEKLCEKTLHKVNAYLLPLILLASEKGLLQDEKTLFKWDGTRYPNRLWNKDQFAVDWIQNQVGWVTDRLVLQLGAKSLNHSFTLKKIFDFNDRFFANLIPAKNGALELTRRLLYIGKYRFGSEVWGLKGSADEGSFFVGHLKFKNQTWSFLTFLDSKNPEGFSAERAQALSMDALTELGLF